MSCWTFLYRPDKRAYFAVVDLFEWRETSRTTQGFASTKTKEILERHLTKEEEDGYKEVWRMYSCRYDELQFLLEDELRITGNPGWVERLNVACEEIAKTV
jgi:hypothetical protein